jgi:hypothetical protein
MEALDYRRVEAPAWCLCGASVVGLRGNECCRRCARLVAEGRWREVWNGERRWLLTLKDGVMWATFGHLVMWVVTVVVCGTRDWLEVESVVPVAVLPDVALALGCWLARTLDPAGEDWAQRWLAAWLRASAVGFLGADVVMKVLACSDAATDLRMWNELDVIQQGCWAWMAVAAMTRGGTLARRMHLHWLDSMCMFAAICAGTGAVMVMGAPVLRADLTPGGPFYWALIKIEDWGSVVDGVGRMGLGVTALIFWATLNMALQRLVRCRGVRLRQETVRYEWVSRRSLRGRLVAESGDQ